MEYKINVRLPGVITNYLSYMSSIKGSSKKTLHVYTTDLILFFRFLKRDRNLVDIDFPFNEIQIYDINKDFIKSIDSSDIYSFLSYTEFERNNSNITRRRKIACLKSFFRFLYNKLHMIDTDLCENLERPKAKPKLPVYLKENECIALLNNITGRNVVRDRCIITLFINTGLRLSELCSINISSIKDDTLVVVGKGNKERYIYLNDACLSELEIYLRYRSERYVPIKEGHEDALFLSEQKRRINPRSVENIVVKAVKTACLDKHYSAHKLRHTCATLLYKAGADIRSIQTLLGHESVATTQIYTHVDQDQIRDIVKLNPLNKQR
ncbi:tyrosine recombinase XerC [uncultured Clostridium sp.]|uniref:tyrosine recombinase XerC n=1 Tax=uncultured Clostridium sp. TaxID=59620 RepID=UPI0025DBEACB|nr:tyrosine recombinase XerC [uncultured Clostridium sp.]